MTFLYTSAIEQKTIKEDGEEGTPKYICILLLFNMSTIICVSRFVRKFDI